MSDAAGPVIVWVNLGYDGWHPTSYPDLKAALLGQRYGEEFVVTRLVNFEVVDLAAKAVSDHQSDVAEQ